MADRPTTTGSPLAPPDPTVAAAAVERLAGLATPAGALGRLGDLAVWLSAAQGLVPPEPLTEVRLVIFAGDHRVDSRAERNNGTNQPAPLLPVERHRLPSPPDEVLVANDGSLLPGARIALRGAIQLNWALRIQQSGDAGGHHHHDH